MRYYFNNRYLEHQVCFFNYLSPSYIFQVNTEIENDIKRSLIIIMIMMIVHTFFSLLITCCLDFETFFCFLCKITSAAEKCKMHYHESCFTLFSKRIFSFYVFLRKRKSSTGATPNRAAIYHAVEVANLSKIQRINLPWKY